MVHEGREPGELLVRYRAALPFVLTPEQEAAIAELDRDLARASHYVHSLLPAPIVSGPVLAEWCFVPSAQLGGDAFGYDWLDPGTFVFYLIDVSGHGAGSAMHSVTVLNVLRQRALPDVDFADPAKVLSSLNLRFPMVSHNDLFFTMWYGVYHPDARTLVYGSAGHHPAYLVGPDRTRADSSPRVASPLPFPIPLNKPCSTAKLRSCKNR